MKRGKGQVAGKARGDFNRSYCRCGFGLRRCCRRHDWRGVGRCRRAVAHGVERADDLGNEKVKVWWIGGVKPRRPSGGRFIDPPAFSVWLACWQRKFERDYNDGASRGETKSE
eukprot:2773261-Pleurochrysis_carterae.AAC.1